MPAELSALARDRNMAGQDERVDKRASDWRKTRLGEFRNARIFSERDWVRNIRAWKMLTTSQGYNGRSNLRLPHIRNMVERLVNRIVQQLIGREHFFEAQPTKWEDEDRAQTIRAILMAQMDEEGFRRKTALCIRDAIIIGTAIKKHCWEYEVEMMNVPVYQGDQWVMGPAGPEMQEVWSQTLQPRILKNRPASDRLNPFNLFVDPAAQDLDDTDTVEVGYLTPTEIFRQVDNGVFDANLVAKAMAEPGMRGQPKEAMGYRQVYDIALGLRFDASSKKTDFYEYQEFWGWFPLEATDEQDARGAKMERVVIGVLGKDHVVRLERNPFLSQKKPYSKGVLIEVPGQFYGDSPVKAALPQWQEINDTRNQSNDSRAFSNNPILLRGPGNEDKKTSYRAFPGAIITGSNLELAKFPDTTQAAMVAEQIMVRELEETFGAPKLLDAQSDAGSATEAAIQKEESGARILGYVKTLEDTLIIPELRFRLDLNRQFLRTKDSVRIKGFSGFDWRPYTPEDFMPEYDFICMGSVAMQARAMLTASFATTTDRMLNFEMVKPGLFDWERWWSTFFRDGLGVEHASLYINPMQRNERVPTIGETIVMLVEGQRPQPDPRQDFLHTLPALATYMAKQFAIMPPDLQKNFREYFRKAVDIAKQVALEQQQMMMQQAMTMMGAKPAAGGPAGAGPQGAAPKPVGPEQRDGRGLGMPRLAMNAMRSGAQGT